MFDYKKHQGGDRAVLIAVEMPDTDSSEIEEFKELVASAGVMSLEILHVKRKTPDAKLFIGSGKADELKMICQALDAEVVIINQSISPSQSRNLEQLCERRVIDRTGLILDIFAQRAQSFEGKLQVELAQSKHLSTRLVRMWTHLERQKGGIGMRGPGETQLESDRRLLDERILQIQKRLEKVESTRNQGRLSRERSLTPTIAFVGYTNAGKSSLFNRLTNAEVYAADQLFATLDPTHRAIHLPQTGSAILVDTVGFIAKLPHELIAAFKSTLQESIEADLLLEVIDCADLEKNQKTLEVEKVLAEIHADLVPRLQVFNKIDCLDDVSPRIERNEEGLATAVWVSAKTGIGIDLLLQAISERFQTSHIKTQLILPAKASKLRAQLYEVDAVIDEQINDMGEFVLQIYIAKRHLAQFASNDALAKEILNPLLSSFKQTEW